MNGGMGPSPVVVDGDDVPLLRRMFAARCRELATREVGRPCNLYTDALDELTGFYYDVLGEYAGGVLHVAMDDGGLESRESLRWCVERALLDPEPDEAGIALGQALLMRDDAREALARRWTARIDAHVGAITGGLGG